MEATYSEPIARRTYLQLAYQYNYALSKSDRSTYDFSSLGGGYFDGVEPAYRSWGSYLALLQQPLGNYFDQSLSRYSEYKTHTQNIQLMIRMNQEKWRFNAGVQLQPQHSIYQQDYLGVHVDTVRNSFDWSPTIDFRYKFSPQSRPAERQRRQPGPASRLHPPHPRVLQWLPAEIHAVVDDLLPLRLRPQCHRQ